MIRRRLRRKVPFISPAALQHEYQFQRNISIKRRYRNETIDILFSKTALIPLELNLKYFLGWRFGPRIFAALTLWNAKS
jgi:hypothetical protein